MKLSHAIAASVLVLGSFSSVFAQSSPSPLSLWPDQKMPGVALVAEAVKLGTEKNSVTNPTISVFPAAASSKPASAILICPGGGYNHHAFDKEGTEIAKWLNTLGITGVVLKYRVPGNREGAFQDVQRAMRTVRSHAKEWNLDPAHIGVMGFSAGGHLSARLSNNYAIAAYPAIDNVDQASCKPDFVILVYPAYLDVQKQGTVAPELPVSANTPPTLIIHNEDDPGYLRGSKIYHAALDAAKVPNEFILFQTGGHGYGLHSTKDVSVWPERAKDWLKKSGVL